MSLAEDSGTRAGRSTFLRHIALFHPAGAAERIVVLGQGGPAIPTARNDEARGDLVVVFPSGAELTQGEWLRIAVERAARMLAPHGIVLLYLPRKGRRTARRHLTAAGLVIRPSVLHAPRIQGSRLLVSTGGSAFSFAAANLDMVRGWRGPLTARLSRIAAVPRLFSRLLGPVAVVAQRPGAPLPMDWAFRAAGRRDSPAGAVVQVGWRCTPDRSVALCFDETTTTPSVVAKVAWDEASAHRLRLEEKALREVAPSAECAGTRVPAVSFSGMLGAHAVLVEAGLDGQRASSLLRSSPGRCGELLERLAGWLECWSLATATASTVDDRVILSILELLSAVDLPAAELSDHLNRLQALADSVRGQPCPAIAAHNDLTMWNVLRTTSGTLGIVDWEEAHRTGIPLADFYYAAADAVSATDGYRDRAAAVRSCFTSDGRQRRLVRPLEHRLQSALGISAGVAQLCFHGCWLRHAVNELRASAPGDPRPFRDIVSWLARHPTELAVGS